MSKKTLTTKRQTMQNEIKPNSDRPAPIVSATSATTTFQSLANLEAAFGETVVTGFEEASSAAYAIPFLRILQDLSPQVKSKMAGFIKGAKPGQIFNTASKQLYDRVRVIPCYFQQTHIEWKPRNSGGGGGGFVAPHPAGTPLLARAVRDEKTGRNILPNGNELMDTRSHFVLVVNPDGSTEGCLIAMSSTGLKVSRTWMTQMKVACAPSKKYPRGLPMFSSSYELWTEEQANEKGQWSNWVVGNREPLESLELFEEAQRFASAAAEGSKVKVDYNEMRDEQHNEPQTAPPADLDNEIEA